MSKTLNLSERLLARGRKLQRLGLYLEALRVLTRLSGLGGLPAAVAEETHKRLAEIQLRRRKYARARRHLAAALSQQPGNPHYHYLMAGAIAADRKCDPNRAAAYYRRCLELDPQQPRYLCDFGLSVLCLGQRAEGLKALRRAFELAPDDPRIAAKVAEGLRQEGEIEEARTTLRIAQFRNPGNACFGKLWSDLQFQVLWDQQQQARPGHGSADDDTPTLLPFVRPVPAPEPAPPPGRVVRRDAAARLNSPHLAQPTRLPDRKHA